LEILTLVFSIFQSFFLISYLRPYFYSNTLPSYLILGMELVTGAFSVVWLSNIIDNKGIGNGTSIIIFTNIVITLISKNLLNFSLAEKNFLIQIVFILFLLLLICISQTARINIDVVSARQLAFLENNQQETIKKRLNPNLQNEENGLSIRLNQAGIFPIIIASNLIPFLSFFTNSLSGNFKIINDIIYYLLIIGFNYFYTTIFWDPEKISEQLRKASVSIF
jgi:preprotein translocase subunit SecY